MIDDDDDDFEAIGGMNDWQGNQSTRRKSSQCLSGHHRSHT
jgi:hypothetical protein